jgi:hypothetical protein
MQIKGWLSSTGARSYLVLPSQAVRDIHFPWRPASSRSTAPWPQQKDNWPPGKLAVVGRPRGVLQLSNQLPGLGSADSKMVGFNGLRRAGGNLDSRLAVAAIY